VRTYRGDEVTQTVPVEIPVNASGPLTLLVADGARLTQWEQREIRRPQQARDVAQMVKAFNKARKNNRLYIRLVSADSGAVVEGESLSALPASVLAVLDGERNGSGVSSLGTATLGEWDIPTEYAVSGARTLTLSLDHKKTRRSACRGPQPPCSDRCPGCCRLHSACSRSASR
jgi:hypothetical protein